MSYSKNIDTYSSPPPPHRDYGVDREATAIQPYEDGTSGYEMSQPN